MNELEKLTDAELSEVLQERRKAHVEALKPYAKAKKLHEEVVLELYSRNTGLRVGVRFLLRNSEWIVKETKVVDSQHIVLASKILRNGKVSSQLARIHTWDIKKLHIVTEQ